MAVTAALRSGTTTSTPNNETVANTGVFLSIDSLTFPVAASTCTIILALVDRFQSGAATKPIWALVVCTVVGAFIIWQGWPQQGDTRTKGQHLAVGLLNILLLTASVLGVSSFATGDPVS